MEDKEKHIEEMSNLINKNLFNYLNQDNLSCKDVCDLLANELLKYYQPKFPEDSVINTPTIQCETYSNDELIVISKEEYKCLKSIEKSYDPFWFCSFGGCEGVCKECKDTCEMSICVKERKETAERYKVAMMLSIQEMQKYLEIDEEQAKILYHHNAEIAKQFSGEIKE